MSQTLSIEIAKRFQAEVAVEIFDLAKFLNLVRYALSLRRRFKVNQLVHQPVKYYEWNEPPVVDWVLPERIAMSNPKMFEWQHEYRLAVPMGGAFNVENVNVNLVSINYSRTSDVKSYPKQLIKLENFQRFVEYIP